MVWPWQRSGARRNRGHRQVAPQAGPADHALPSPTSVRTPAFAPTPTRDAPSATVGGATFGGLRPVPLGGSTVGTAAHDLIGVDPSGNPLHIRVVGTAGRTLLAFLSVDCLGCKEFWRALGDSSRLDLGLDRGVVVTKGPQVISAQEVADLAADLSIVPVIMSDEAWSDYRVLGYPFFIVVDGSSGTVVGETVGMGWDDVASMISAANR